MTIEEMVPEEGIICGVDAKQFWLLPWFLENLAKTNPYPVTIFDFGLNSLQRSELEKRFILQKISRLPMDCLFEDGCLREFQAVFSEKHGPCAWDARDAWFKKPLALLKSPYKRTLWLDLDCEVIGDLKPVFDVLKDGADLCLALDPKQSAEYPIYNSGVIGFREESDCIQKWAKRALDPCIEFRGDQDVLSYVIFEEKADVYQLDSKYNYSFTKPPSLSTVICHYMGSVAKNFLRSKLLI